VTDLRGTWFVLPTPFKEDGALDLPSVRSLTEAALTWGVDGLTAMGVTSEAVALTAAERTAALREITEAVGGRVPLVVGCSGESEEAVVELAREAGELGAVSAMVSAPQGHSDLDTLPEFFAIVARGAPIPLVVQDEPAATGVTIPVDRLVESVDASRATTVKLEDAPTPPKISDLLAARPGLSVFGGLGGVSALNELRAGACGTMTGFAFPEVLRALRRAQEDGDEDRAETLFGRYLPLIRVEAQGGVALRKELLRRRGVIRTSVARRAPKPDDGTLRRLDEALEEVGIRPSLHPLEVS
jgi:4-hydroxy-tetrahydrodipicolinate synthase